MFETTHNHSIQTSPSIHKAQGRHLKHTSTCGGGVSKCGAQHHRMPENTQSSTTSRGMRTMKQPHMWSPYCGPCEVTEDSQFLCSHQTRGLFSSLLTGPSAKERSERDRMAHSYVDIEWHTIMLTWIGRRFEASSISEQVACHSQPMSFPAS